MRTLLIAGMATALIALTADGAVAQRVVQRGPGASYPVPGQGVRPAPVRSGGHVPARRAAPAWRARDGRWTGGWNAPGGWNAYRRPFRGWALPGYWTQPGFAIADWSAYGLAPPPAGYGWSRYYDDAVLSDRNGSVYDTVGGVDWDRGDDGYYNDDRDRAEADRRFGRRDDGRDDGPDNGLRGAAIGAVAGGIGGNVIAGRGNRLGGTLIGAGVGAAAGYAIDKAEDRGRRAPPPRYATDYPRSAPGGYPPPPRDHWVSPDGRTTVTTTSAGGYPGGATTTVTVQAPVVTTTTTEVYEDNVTYTRPVARKVWRRKARPTKTLCRCS